jgi:hypothetical protein
MYESQYSGQGYSGSLRYYLAKKKLDVYYFYHLDTIYEMVKNK